MLKVITIVGTRPELIRLSRVISCLNQYTNHILVHTGQNYDYELNEIFFEDLDIKPPDHFLDAAEPGVARTIGNVISRFDEALEQLKPDALLVLGDTNSCLGVIPAKKRKIPIFHMEAGNRCFDQRVPEEANRILVDHLSDINMPYSEHAREHLLREGIPTDRIIKTGSPLYEVLQYYNKKIDSSDILKSFGLKKYDYFVISSHREENIDSSVNFEKLVTLLNYLSKKYKKKIIFTTHPRTRKRFEKEGKIFDNNIKLVKPLKFTDYIQLQQHSLAVLSDSGTITEESSILNFPALNIREVHERPEGMEEGAVMLTGMNTDRITEALDILSDQPRDKDRLLEIVKDYRAPNVSEKVVRIIHSYVDYIDRFVWRKFI